MCVIVQSIFVGFFTFQTMLLVIPEPIAKTYPSTWMATPDLLNGCIVMKDNGKNPTKIEEFTIPLAIQSSLDRRHGSIISQSPGALGRNRTTWELGLDHSRRDAGWVGIGISSSLASIGKLFC